MDLSNGLTPERGLERTPSVDDDPGAGQTVRAPTGLETVDATLLDGFLAVYGRSGKDVQQAVYEARAREGPAAYERLKTDPAFFGEVVNREAHASLAVALPVRDQTADYLGIPLPEKEPREPELTRDPGIYVSGPRADDFVTMLSARTGLNLRHDSRGALVVDGAVSPLPNGASATLRSLVIELTSGRAGQRPVQVNAVDSSNGIFFDVDRRAQDARRSDFDKVDMGDFDAASPFPEFQAAQLGHLLTERMTPGSYMSGHVPALETERAILQEMTGVTVQRRAATESAVPPAARQRISAPDGVLEARDMFDYGSIVYGVVTPESTRDRTGQSVVPIGQVRGLYRVPSVLR